jgi:hypothetical protein
MNIFECARYLKNLNQRLLLLDKSFQRKKQNLKQQVSVKCVWYDVLEIYPKKIFIDDNVFGMYVDKKDVEGWRVK